MNAAAAIAWDSAITFVLRMEGGYANDPHDTGGETNFGISKRAYPREDIKHLTVERAITIYERDYWRPSGAADFADVRPRLALVHLDWAVNHGVGGAVRTLQRILDVDADGVFGPKSVAAARCGDETRTVADYLERRAAWYRERVAQRPDQAKWLPIWLARLRACAKACGVPTLATLVSV